MQAGKAAEPRVRQRPVGAFPSNFLSRQAPPYFGGVGGVSPLSRQAPSPPSESSGGRVSAFELRGRKDFSFQDTTL